MIDKPCSVDNENDWLFRDSRRAVYYFRRETIAHVIPVNTTTDAGSLFK
jgi:hypothetical protein